MRRTLATAAATGLTALALLTGPGPAQAEPDIEVKCSTIWYDGEMQFVRGERCSGAPVGSKDRGRITLDGGNETFECDRVSVHRQSGSVIAIGINCERA